MVYGSGPWVGNIRVFSMHVDIAEEPDLYVKGSVVFKSRDDSLTTFRGRPLELIFETQQEFGKFVAKYKVLLVN